MTFDQVLQRRTIRLFSQKEVPDGEIRYMLEAASVASCGGNRQQIRYVAVREKSMVREVFLHTRYAALVAPRHVPEWGSTSPVAFVAVCSVNPVPADMGAAVQSMEFAAWNHGIGCCWIGSFDQPEVTALLHAETCPVRYLVAVGYPAESPVLEKIGPDGSPAYYLDGNDVLHVPKWEVDALTRWM